MRNARQSLRGPSTAFATDRSRCRVPSHSARTPTPADVPCCDVRRADGGLDVVDLAVVREGVELRARELLDPGREVVAQFAERRPAMVADHLRGIEGAAEEAPAVAALLGHQQRREGVLRVGRDERREIPEQRLQPA